jgi:AcrR family transcriptional regulator
MSFDSARTPPSEPQSGPDEQTRQRLLRAAVHVFDRKGYAAASVREIVERAGVTKPALYYHFQSKDGLLAEVLAEGWRQFESTLERAIARPGSVRARLAALADDIYALLELHVPFVRVAHAVFFSPGYASVQFDLASFDRSLERAIRRLVEEGVATGELLPVDPGHLAVAVGGIVGGCAARTLHHPHRGLGPDEFRKVLALLLDGIARERDFSGDPAS